MISILHSFHTIICHCIIVIKKCVFILQNRNSAMTLEVYQMLGEIRRRVLSSTPVPRFSTTATTATGEVVPSHVKAVCGPRPNDQHATVSLLPCAIYPECNNLHL